MKKWALRDQGIKDWANKYEKRLKQRLSKQIRTSKLYWETEEGKTEQIKLRRRDWAMEELSKDAWKLRIKEKQRNKMR
jgi:hypothetical protein